MSRFLQLHLLTFFPPANMNRDDTGRPKTAVVGGAPRLRLSSQALKRAWRTSEAFAAALKGHMGVRTQRIGEDILGHLAGRVPEQRAIEIARLVVGGSDAKRPVFGKLKPATDPHPTRTEQLAFIPNEEREAALALADRLVEDGSAKVQPEGVLTRTDTAADIALFGRMLADNPDYNREAAAQVAHAITTHRVTVEDDYYTAVDDLKTAAEDAGAGFLGEAAFGSGVFYLYLCIDRALLVKNLGGDTALAATALGALAEAAATVAPRGKQNSFAAHGRAHYVLAEKGDQQPRTLAGAFARPVMGDDLPEQSVQALVRFRDGLAEAYGRSWDAERVMHVGKGGTLADIVAFCRD
jgi:CRISPR system Cascade subunit CasC